jgi:hypothetical protein
VTREEEEKKKERLAQRSLRTLRRERLETEEASEGD